jgi:peptidoglycan/LPS O-acetylase OafA/YrhL
VVSLIVLAPVYRIVMAVFDPANKVAFVLTIGCFDALGIGGLLACAQRSGADLTRDAGRLLAQRLLWFGLPAWVTVEALDRFHVLPEPLLHMRQTFMDMVFGWLVFTAARGFSGWVGWFLRCSPMVYLGKISYGLYVFHNLAIYGLVLAVRDLHAPKVLQTNPWVERLGLLILTVSAAAVSWHLYEKPLNNLKRFFPYKPRPRRAQPALAGSV